jgi:hypothetical protein
MAVDIEGGFSSESKQQELLEGSNVYFAPIEPDKSNSEILLQIISSSELVQELSARLIDLESTGYWYNEKFSAWINDLIAKGTLPAPQDPVDRDRWLALVYISVLNKVGFSYGNIVCAADFLPDGSEEFEEYDRIIGNALEDIRERRARLRAKYVNNIDNS